MSELAEVGELLYALDGIAAAPPGSHALWDCTIAAWAAASIRELLASVDTLPEGGDAKLGSVRSKGSAVPKADAHGESA